MPSPLPPAATPTVREIERRIRWRAMAVVLFLALLLGLAVVALVPMLAPPPIVSGLPADPDVTAAAALVRGRIVPATGELRSFSSLLGAGPAVRGATPDEVAIAEAVALLARARDRNPAEPRILAGLASLDLARGRVGEAERRYREAIDLAEAFGEARLGLGVTLALGAAGAEREPQARGLLLQAIAQFGWRGSGGPPRPARWRATTARATARASGRGAWRPSRGSGGERAGPGPSPGRLGSPSRPRRPAVSLRRPGPAATPAAAGCRRGSKGLEKGPLDMQVNACIIDRGDPPWTTSSRHSRIPAAGSSSTGCSRAAARR
jgi:hypothetical protein